ncbi:MAG: hypothetical protein H6717_31750 [Polyangiaceae bacterium]|nr:hypothetical protein [Polyangiaceae bacterium]
MKSFGAWAFVVGIALVACGGSDDAGLSGSGGSAGSTGGASGTGTGGGNTGGAAGAGTGGSNTGGASGAGTGGTAGSASGGAAGNSSGGAAGSATGGAAGTGTGGSSGVTFINSGPCPDSPPAVNDPCNAFAICCYAAGEKPLICTGGTGTNPHWTTSPNRVCCPAEMPATGSQCNTPGAITCCYPNGGLYCNTQPNPDEWAQKDGCN